MDGPLDSREAGQVARLELFWSCWANRRPSSGGRTWSSQWCPRAVEAWLRRWQRAFGREGLQTGGLLREPLATGLFHRGQCRACFRVLRGLYTGYHQVKRYRCTGIPLRPWGPGRIHQKSSLPLDWLSSPSHWKLPEAPFSCSILSAPPTERVRHLLTLKEKQSVTGVHGLLQSP